MAMETAMDPRGPTSAEPASVMALLLRWLSRQLAPEAMDWLAAADGRGGGKGFMPHVGPLTRKGYIDLIDDASLAMVITEGGEAMGKSGFMPSWKATLSKDDIVDVIAYIRTLPLSDGPQ
jgi:mono/diheme cytochrome c family protein